MAVPSAALLLLLLLLLCRLAPGWAGGGAAADLVVGQTAPLTGPEGEYGRRLARGLQLAFAEANAGGGVGGRNVTLVVLDDAHNVSRAVANARQLLTLHGATLLAGLFEAASLAAVLEMPEVAQRGVPIVGPYTGVTLVRVPFQEQVVNVRASMSDEIIAQGAFLVETLQVDRVACLYWDGESGQAALNILQGALAYVGKVLVSSAMVQRETTNMSAAVESIVGNDARPQAIVIATLQAQTLAFLQAFRQHPLADPDCFFLLLSHSLTPSALRSVPSEVWPNLHVFQTVPVATDDEVAITQRVAQLCRDAGETSDALLLEGYVAGRLIVAVLRGIQGGNYTGPAFLDQLYSARLFIIDGLTVGLYSRDYPGCAASLCACNTGLRDVFLGEVTASGILVPNMKASHGENTFRYPITQCACDFADQIHPTLAYAQLVPRDDPLGRAIALEIADGIQVAMDEANEAHMFGHREFGLLQVEYSGDPAAALRAAGDRYPLLGLLGSVVPCAADLRSNIPTFATYETGVYAQEDPFDGLDLRVQPSTPFELMALASFAVQTPNCPIHLRAPMTSAGAAQLDLMLRSVHSQQARPTSSRAYNVGEAPFSDIASGCVLLVGDDAAVQQWYVGLEAKPLVYVLTLSSIAARLRAANATALVSPAASRFRFPTLFRYLSDDTTRNGTKSDSWLFGHVSLELTSQALRAGPGHQPYTMSHDLLDAWYQTKLLGFEGTFFGPYLAARCTFPGEEDCECANGARTVTMRSLASRNLGLTYTTKSCQVQYQPLAVPADKTWILITGIVAGIGGAALLSVGVWAAVFRGRRNNRAAPKDPAQPFCVLFTDIQASTHLWATAPEHMAAALGVHHSLIRQLIVRHHCYEVKTIGDSFMCAARTPAQALGLALAIQTRLFDHDWGTAALDEAYSGLIPEEICPDRSCWSGLRVRVGIHLGHGDIILDPVSHGYDYYGTVVNTAARIESVCHGGQIGVSQAVYDALGGVFPNAVWACLGAQPLRGLQEPVRLWQVLPAGPLAHRCFPPLRLDKAAAAEESGQTADDPRSKSLAEHSASSSDEAWAGRHPLVQSGAATAEDLRRHHAVALAALATLLAAHTQRAKEQVLRGFCERLHVPYCGVDGALLQRSLHGLVLRVLPATLTAAAAGAESEPLMLPLNDRQRRSVCHQVYVLPPSPSLSRPACPQ